MRKLKRYLLSLLIPVFLLSFTIPAHVTAAGYEYGLILGDKNNNYQLVNNLVVTSPAGNLMIKAYGVCKKLGLTYSYNQTTKALTIKNPNNDSSLVFTMGRKSYTYYSGKSSEGIVKTAAYKFYYDNNSKSNVVHMSTLRYILNYNYYNNLADTYYQAMGYKAIIAYSIKGYSSYDIPVTEAVINYINSGTFTTKEELLDAVRMNLLMHKTGITFQTDRAVMDEIGSQNSIFDLISNLDNKDTSKDADYLSLLIDQIGQSWHSTSTVITYPDGTQKVIKADDDPASLTIDVQYETTLAQERTVDSRVADILKELKLEGLSDYDMVVKIHDYIIHLASYDTTYQKSSAYDLIVNKTAVCEGYTLTAYRLFTDAGLDCRIISGYGDGEPHAWNIVKVDGEWYNIDLTWDDPITNSGEQVLRYDYFLKNEEDFKNHVRDQEYNTTQFLNNYPIAEESYPANLDSDF